MLKANYTHFVPEAKENLDYDKHLNYVLIKDFEDLKDKLHLENEIVAWDTETSSLSPQEGDIVGFSWSVDGITGYYCPVDHIDCKIDGSIEYFVSELKKAKLSLLYNARFDIRMVEWYLKKCKSGEDLSFMRNKFIDVMNAVWIADTNYTLPSLKWATRHFLGYQPPKFLETLGDETNFHFVKVKDAFTYAALDAINTFNVFKVCQCYHNEAGIASYLDTQASWIIGHLEETPLKLNTEKIKKIMVDVKRDLDDIENSIYELAGEKFNIRSNRELTKIFLKLGIDTGERTKAGDMKTSKTLLGSYLERYPDTIILKKIIDYKETFKFYNSYLKTLVEIGDNQNEKPIRFSYKLQAADTTRLSCCDKNTIIYTNHGIKKITELNDGDKVDDGTGKFYPASLLNMGKKMLYEVRFSDGTVSHLTNDHKLLTVGENGYVWKELKDIEINKDKICVKYNNWRKEETDELFYLYVILAYKSRIVDEKKILIESTRYGKELYDKVTKVLEKYGIQYDNAKVAMKLNHRNKKGASEYKILVSGDNYDKLVQIFKDQYSINAKSDIFDAFKPDISLINSIQKAETFLECVNDVKIYKYSDKNIQHEFIGDNQDILKDIKTVLSFVGVSSEPIRPVLDKYKERKDMDGKYLFNTTSAIFYKYMFDSNYRVGSYPSLKAPQFIKKYILNHPIINYKLWRNEAGKRVLRRFEQTPNFNYCINFNEEFELGLDIFYYITVDSIEEYKVDDTYTLSVDSDKHRYMSDSFISHNCGKDGKNPFFSKLNLQSIPKPKSCKSYGRRATKEEIENKEDLLGWIFSPDHPEWSPGVCVEGMSLNKNIRDAFIPEHGSDDYLVSIDMSAEEARIVTNLFKEQYFADIINGGGDIHHENSNRIFGSENYTKETRKKAKCISGDSKVFTSMGIKNVSDLISSRNIGVPVKTDFMISTPEGVSNCNGVVYNGKKETLKFTLEDESVLEVTSDHLLRSNNKWIKAENIKINDKIDLTLCPIDVTNEQVISFDNFIPGTKIPFNEELAYLTGAILGDGCIDKKVVRYYSEDTELKSYIEYISKKYSLYKKYASDNELEVSRIYNAGKGKSGKDYERLIVGARKCVELMKSIGITDDNYHKIFRVPEIVNNSPIKVKFAFLQGLFDTDGYVSSQSKGCIAIHLATAHKTLGDDCVTLLRSIGIISRIRTEYSKQWNRDYYKVKITAFSSKLFYEYGGFKCVKKQERLKEWYNSENTGKKCYVTGYKVTDIKQSESEVFDLSVNNDSHSFLVNGFVVHNCALFGMLYGQGERGFQQKFPYMSIEEAKDFLDTFKTLIPNIVRGQARMTREARKTGTFKTTFGHSIRIKSYLTSSNYKDKAFGERKIKNCYSPDTEFLTLEGWKYAKYITPITQIAYYDPKTNLIRFTSAGERLTNICTESVKYESKVASWNVTKNHNMWVRDSRNDNWRFIEAEKLVNKKVFEELASCRDLCEDLLEIGEVETPIGKYSRYDLAKLFGWLITDSNINHLNHIIITQTKEENFNEIINTVKKFNGTFTIKNKNLYKSGKILYARICRNEFVKWCIEQMGGKLKKDRNIPKFILNSDISVRDAFIHSVINGDGNRQIDRNSVRVWHCSRKFVNAFQSLLIYSGYRCSYKEYKGKKGQSLYSINIIESDVKSMDTRTNKYGRSNISIVKHEPMEFSCFNVPTHILITRHNGKVSFHGNSPIQGCAAEVLKLEFVRLWDNVFTKYPEIKFHSTIHDEINFSVPRRLADEVIPIMIKCMTVKMEDWLVPLDCSLSVGYTMGTLIPFKYNFETKEFIPDWEELVEKKDTKEVQEDEEETDEYMDDIEDGYEDSDFDI